MFGTRRSSLTTASHNPTTGIEDRRLHSDEIFKLAGENSVLIIQEKKWMHWKKVAPKRQHEALS